jgi:hypothetical protein
MKKKSLLTNVIILGIGVLIGLLVSNYTYNRKIEYFELQEDYTDDSLGVIKKGTLLKYDQPFSEGFTRFILYINIHDSEAPKFKKESLNNEIIPYWIEKKE